MALPGPIGDGAADDGGLVGDEACDLHVTAGGTQVVPDPAGQVDPATAEDHVALDVARDFRTCRRRGLPHPRWNPRSALRHAAA